jgi:hypothetical protein
MNLDEQVTQSLGLTPCGSTCPRLLLVLGFNELNTFGSRTGRMLGAGIPSKTLFLLVGEQHARFLA